jgi:plasmid stabilization system protein ParE
MGHKFLDEIPTIILKVGDTPLMYPNVHRNTRRTIVQRFPFGIHYRVKESTIGDFAVIHGSRNPGRWKHGINYSVNPTP